MLELFSCRNCIHNCGQSINIGRGVGYCLQHDSVISEPLRTTCKYLHRKDLPGFVVDEAIREHAAEFAGFPRLVTLDSKQSIERVPYSEEYSWEHRQFDPLTHALTQYFKSSRRWVFVQAFTAGTDGRRSLAHASLVRHYMNHCGTWTSSYRLVLGLLKEIDKTPHFDGELVDPESSDSAAEALWDVMFNRLSTIQEYGWHAGIEPLMWVSDSINGSLSEFNWPDLQTELKSLRESFIEQIIDHAKSHHEYFRKTVVTVEDGDDE